MPPRNEGIYVVAGSEFRRVRDQLAAQEASMGNELGDALQDAVGPILADVRRAAMSLPARGARHTGLRGRLAAGVAAQTDGQHVRITSSMADPSEAALPRGMDNGARGWRHPVFGNRDVWVTQRGGSWFRGPIAGNHEQVERRLTDVLEEAARSIDAVS